MKMQNHSDPVFSRHRNTELSADGCLGRNVISVQRMAARREHQCQQGNADISSVMKELQQLENSSGADELEGQ